MRFVGVIPARGGSKGLPGKNVAACAGKPLLAWTGEAAKASRRLGRTLLSTDSEEIAAAGRALGIEVPFLRPAELARDDTPALPVLRHALDWLASTGEEPDALVLLQPTSPLRTARHIDEAAELFESARADTVVSVVEVPHNFHPSSVMVEREGSLHPFLEGTEMVTRRQDQAALLARNGPAVLIVSSAMVRFGALYGGRTVGYRMSPQDSIDVDTADDLREAARLLASRPA